MSCLTNSKLSKFIWFRSLRAWLHRWQSFEVNRISFFKLLRLSQISSLFPPLRVLKNVKPPSNVLRRLQAVKWFRSLFYWIWVQELVELHLPIRWMFSWQYYEGVSELHSYLTQEQNINRHLFEGVTRSLHNDPRPSKKTGQKLGSTGQIPVRDHHEPG